MSCVNKNVQLFVETIRDKGLNDEKIWMFIFSRLWGSLKTDMNP